MCKYFNYLVFLSDILFDVNSGKLTSSDLKSSKCDLDNGSLHSV